jgi:hypothetical protein
VALRNPGGSGPIDIVAVHKAHARFLTRHSLMVQKEAEQAGQFGVQHVQDHPTFKPRTGELQRKTSAKVLIRRNGKILQLRNTAKHAHAIDLGAKPHVIKARRGKSLRFMVGGKVVFRRSVKHPGNRPYRFLYRATNAAGRVLQQGLREGMEREARRF